MKYNFDIPIDTFTPLRRNEEGKIVQTAISYGLGTTRTGMPPPYLPSELITPPPQVGSIVEFRVPVPPGVALVGWNAQWTNQVVEFSADDGPMFTWEPPLFPLGHNPNTMPAPTAANTAYREAVARIRVNGVSEFVLFSVTWTLADDGAAPYEAWVAAGRPVNSTPESHEDRVLRLINEAGLMEPLMKLANETDINVFAHRAIQTGTWDGFLRLL